MVLEWIAAAGVSAGSGLFQYNRKNFQFNKDQELEKIYQGMEMRIKQFELYREDVRDLVDLTVRKMDNYLIVNTLQLGFAVTLFTEGRPEPDEPGAHPPWLLFLWTVCNLGSFTYYLLSIWLAMHASVAAHSFGVRILTQFVRLPVPNSAELDAARALSADYEEQGIKDYFRVPVYQSQMEKMRRMQQQMENLTTDDASEADSQQVQVAANSSPVAALEHVQQFRTLQANWQAYDAYARVCMAMGTNQTMMAFSYYCLGLLTEKTKVDGSSSVPWSAFSCLVIFVMCAWTLARLDLYLSPRILLVAALLLVTPPMLALVSAMLCQGSKMDSQEVLWARILVPVVFAIHILWMFFILKIAQADYISADLALPTKFRSVLYLDVFGWLQQKNDAPDDADIFHGGMRQAAAVPSDAPSQSPGDAVAANQNQSLPRVARRLVFDVCGKEQAELHAEIGVWENGDVQKMLHADQKELVKRLRQRLQGLREEFDSLASQQHDLASVNAAALSSPSQPPTWLKLAWKQGPRSMPYFYNRLTFGTSMPQTLNDDRVEDANVSDLETIQARLEKLDNDISAVRDDRPSSSQPGFRRGQTQPLDLQQSHTFHPQNQVDAQRPDSRPHRKPIGQMPWHSFLQGTILLTLCWLGAFIWATVYCIEGVGILPEVEEPELSSWMEVKVQSWPHPFVQSTSLACDVTTARLTFAESYGAFSLPMGHEKTKDPQMNVFLQNCLSGQRGFLGRGLLSASMSCNAGACSPVFLGGGGNAVLICNASEPARQIPLFGGPWQTVAAVGSEMWVTDSSSLVLLKMSEDGFVPQHDIPLGDVNALSDLHVHGTWIMGLDPSAGRLHAWSTSMNAKATWRLPRSLRFTGLCASEDSLFLSGTRAREATAGVWQFPLPSQIAR
jgi:hypothetical protein